MSKDIKEFIHYYWNTPMMAAPNHSPTAKPIECMLLGIPRSGTEYEMISADGVEFFSFGYTVKPILRKLESMTEEEKEELETTKAFQRATPVHQIGIRVWTAESYHWAFKKGFDVFYLIEAGLAIDKETLVKPGE